MLPKWKIWFRSGLSATYEIAFLSIPIIVWVSAIISANPSTDISKLVAWPFLALSMWGNGLRDSIRAFSSNPSQDKNVQGREKYQREAMAAFSIVGLVFTCVLLTNTVLHSLGSLPNLWSPHWCLVWVSLAFSVGAAWIAKAILIQRNDYGHYV